VPDTRVLQDRIQFSLIEAAETVFVHDNVIGVRLERVDYVCTPSEIPF
jgi:hypothetical protein